MNKEELEKEAEEKYVEVDREFIDCQDEGEIFNLGYLAGAEPREKQITILSKHILELQKDKGNLIDRCRELEQQNNWLEGCKSELGEHLGKANDRIAVLEKRCANYEMTISKMEKGTCDICKETEKDKKIEELEAQIEKMKCCGNCKYGCIACGNYLCELLLNNCNSIPFHCDKWEIKENE